MFSISNTLFSAYNQCKPYFHLRSWWTIKKSSSFYGKSNKSNKAWKQYGNSIQKTKPYAWEERVAHRSKDYSIFVTYFEI